jgi:putative proteasome-type protease
MRLDDGLVVMSDTRTNAGVDNISTYRKLHVFRPAADRIFVLQSAGNLATTQEVLDRLSHDLRAAERAESLATVNEMYEAALYVGRVSRMVVNEHRDGLMSSGADGTATFILSGQITGGPPDIMLIYPEGTTFAPPTTGPSCRSARASTASSCSTSASARTRTWRSPPSSRWPR